MPVLHKVINVLLGAVVLSSILASITRGAEVRPCDTGRAAALRGNAPDAISRWEKLAADRTPKEKLRAIMTCLRNSGIAITNEDAAKWDVDVATKSEGPAVLYAGMLYASGAGVPQDLIEARKYLQRARKLHISQAAEVLSILDEAEKAK